MFGRIFIDTPGSLACLMELYEKLSSVSRATFCNSNCILVYSSISHLQRPSYHLSLYTIDVWHAASIRVDLHVQGRKGDLG